MIKPKIGIDWDDVTAPFNSLAIKLANEKYNITPPLTLEDITSWENTGRASVIKEFYHDKTLYDLQEVSEKTKACIRELEEIADVYFITAAIPEFMGIRAMQIRSEFPELGYDRIILGAAKHLVQFDITLDDNICNVLESPATYPVLFRKPWNKNMTGLLSVTKIEDFVTLVKHIVEGKPQIDNSQPRVIALVGPSGSKKNDIAKSLCLTGEFQRPRTFSTKKCDYDEFSQVKYISANDFVESDFLEHTMYAGHKYGCRAEDLEAVLNAGKNVVVPVDICGAIALKRKYPTTIVYLKRNKPDIIMDIVSSCMSDEEKTLRLLSLDAERKNSVLSDIVIDANKDEVEITGLILTTLL